jgi:hypothetical protein
MICRLGLLRIRTDNTLANNNGITFAANDLSNWFIIIIILVDSVSRIAGDTTANGTKCATSLYKKQVKKDLYATANGTKCATSLYKKQVKKDLYATEASKWCGPACCSPAAPTD